MPHALALPLARLYLTVNGILKDEIAILHAFSQVSLPASLLEPPLPRSSWS